MKKLLLILLLFFTSCTRELPNIEKTILTEICKISDLEYELKAPAIKPKPALILLDFDGHSFYEGCNATEAEKLLMQTYIRQMFSLWDVVVTLSEAQFQAFTGPKQRLCFITYGGATGFATMNTMITGDDFNVCAVSWNITRSVTCCYNNNPNVYAAWVGAHEIGHTLGLYHQVRNCEESYAGVLNGYAPLMGNTLDATNTGWVDRGTEFFIKHPSCPTTQRDIAIISKTIKRLR